MAPPAAAISEALSEHQLGSAGAFGAALSTEQAAAANTEGYAEMSQGLAGRRAQPFDHFAAFPRALDEQLHVVLAEAEAERRQDGFSPSRAAGTKPFSPIFLEGREQEDQEAGAAILEAALAEGPEAAIESGAERGLGFGGFCFDRDWKVSEDFAAAAERRPPMRSAETVHFHAALRGEKERLRTTLVQDVGATSRAERQQMARMARAEMVALASSCEGAVHEEFDLEQATALQLAQDRGLAARAEQKRQQEEEAAMRQHAAAPGQIRFEQAEHVAGGVLGASDRMSSDGELSAALSEQLADQKLADLGAARRRPPPSFERDWRVRELPLPTTEAGGALPESLAADMIEGRKQDLHANLTKQSLKPPSHNEVQALQQWLVAANAMAGQTSPGADYDLAMARQTVERNPDDSSQRTCRPAEPADLEGLRAQLVAATGGLAPVTA